MSYNPSLMHIMSAERRIANDCYPSPLQTLSESGYASERLNWDIPMKNPIQAYDVKSLKFIAEYTYTREMTMDNANSIRQRAMRGAIAGDILYVRKYPFEAFTIHAKKEFVNEIVKAKEKSKCRPVTAENVKTGEILKAESITKMAILLDTVPSSVSMYLLREIVYHDWGIWYTEKEKPAFRAKTERRGSIRPDRSKPCVIINKDTKQRTDYPSVATAAKIIGINVSTLRHEIERGHSIKKMYQGFYIGENGELVNPLKIDEQKHRCRNISVIAIDNTTGEHKTFDSVKLASDALCVDRSTLSNCARAGYNCKGHKVFLVFNGEILRGKKKVEHKNSKAVIAYNDKEELEFHSQTACAKAIKATANNISRAIISGHTVKGYKVRNKD